MTGDMAPLAMTMGDPAGIGPELALAAWRDRTPGAPFVVFAAPGVLAAAAKRAGLTVPIVEIDPAGARAAFSKGLPVVPLNKAVEDAPGRPSAANAAATIKSIERAVEAVRQGHAARGGDQPDRQSHALSGRLQIPRTHRISRRARRGLGRSGLSGDDDLVGDAGGCPGDHPYSARRRAKGADRRPHHQNRAHRRSRPARPLWY